MAELRVKMSDNLPVLPDELITTSILPRLPANSVGRFRCVSKPWRSSLSTLEFAKSHLKLHTDDPEELIEAVCALRIWTFTRGGAANDAVSRQVIFPLQGMSWFRVVGSCNGLVLLESAGIDLPMVLMNPTTLEAVRLPKCPDVYNHTLCLRLLDCPGPPCKTPLYGLGYDSYSDDYKIVLLSLIGQDSYETKVDVYSVRKKCWRRIEPSPYQHIYATHTSTGVFLNNRLHWLATGTPVTIAAFNLASEKFEDVPLPRSTVGVDLSVFEFDVRVLEGRLILSDGRFDVWVMEEYGEQRSWTKLATLDFLSREDGGDRFPGDRYPTYRVVYRLNEDDEIVVTKNSKHLFAFNWITGSWRRLVAAGAPLALALASTPVMFKDSLTFKESLVSLTNY